MCDYLGLRMNITKNSFVIYSKELYDYLLPLGYSNEKYIPKEVFTLDKECLNIFLDNYVLGDGHERTCNNDLVQNSSERILFTSSKRLRDDLSYLILLCGFYPSINIHTHKGTVSNHKNGEYVQKDDVYRIAINKSKYTTFSSCTVDKIPYDDFVYCVELPKWHTLWVMRNGKTSWNGNCRCVVYYTTEEPNVKLKHLQ
jgi:intein/homing endonuclease